MVVPHGSTRNDMETCVQFNKGPHCKGKVVVCDVVCYMDHCSTRPKVLMFGQHREDIFLE
jgi:hypothetical protein